MKIYLFLSNKLYKFLLPIEVSGSFSFDVEDDAQSKLINIEAREDKWYLYSTEDSEIVGSSGVIEDLPLYGNLIANTVQPLLVLSPTLSSGKLFLFLSNISPFCFWKTII